MRKSGLQLLLSSMGLEINPEEIMTKYNEAKDIMPKLATFVSNLDNRLKLMHEDMIMQIERFDIRLARIEAMLQESQNGLDTRGTSDGGRGDVDSPSTCV